MTLTNYITAIRTITYDTQQIRESLCDFYDDPSDVTDEEIIAMIDDWASEDLGTDYRLVDEDGNEL